MSNIDNTRILTAADVGNVLPPDQVRPGGGRRSKCPPGTVGLMNTGLTLYRRANGPDGALSDLDIGRWSPNVLDPDTGKPYVYNKKQRGGGGRLQTDPATGKPYTFGLAGFFQVAPRTVRRWTAQPQPLANGQTIPSAPANCLQVASVGKRVIQLAPIETTKNDTDKPGPQARALFAAALAVRDTDGDGGPIILRPVIMDTGAGTTAYADTVESGGLQRRPIMSGRHKSGKPYCRIVEKVLLADALEYLWEVYTGSQGGELQKGWIQLTIEPPSKSARGLWRAVIVLTYWRSGDGSDNDADQIRKGNQ